MSNFSCWYVGPSFPLARSPVPWALFLWYSSYSLKTSRSTLGFALLVISVVQADCRLAPWEGSRDEARDVVAKPWSGLATGPPTTDSPTCVREDLWNRRGVDLVFFSWQRADHSEDSTKTQQPVHMSSAERLKTFMNRCYFIAPATFRLALVPVSFFSFKTLIES